MTLPHIEYSQEDTLAGKVAIVTGAGGGFGEAIARLFANRGARAAVLDIRLDAAERVRGRPQRNADRPAGSVRPAVVGHSLHGR